MYTNVPKGGSIDSVQQQWVTNGFATAPTGRALILALHDPVFSFDVFHSGHPPCIFNLNPAGRTPCPVWFFC